MSALESISNREFELYAMALASGPNFGEARLMSTWSTVRKSSIGATFWNPQLQKYGHLAMRRRLDHRFVLVAHQFDSSDHDAALNSMREAMNAEGPPEPTPPGQHARPLLLDLQRRTPCDNFKLLTETLSHRAAMLTVGEIYLSLPNPDDNFASDFQTENFNARLWELYLFACLREQGIGVIQAHASPDFHIHNSSEEAFVEAVTANPQERQAGFPAPVHAPEDSGERLAGQAAVRFAKTLRSKLQREYQKLPHVRGRPFALAIADFHAPSSMVWSREALPTYLYGRLAVMVESNGAKSGSMENLPRLRGPTAIPAGLFLDEAYRELSAVIFSNAGTLAKFNRMGYLAGFRMPGVTMRRCGSLFDRRPGVFEPIPFDLDVLSGDYARLWPGGEAWCQELDVFHNPHAKVPLSFDLLPGATHWFEREGEIVCETIWKNSVLASVTLINAPAGAQGAIKRTTAP